MSYNKGILELGAGCFMLSKSFSCQKNFFQSIAEQTACFQELHAFRYEVP